MQSSIRLNERQVAVLEWLRAGSPAGIFDDDRGLDLRQANARRVKTGTSGRYGEPMSAEATQEKGRKGVARTKRWLDVLPRQVESPWVSFLGFSVAGGCQAG